MNNCIYCNKTVDQVFYDFLEVYKKANRSIDPFIKYFAMEEKVNGPYCLSCYNSLTEEYNNDK